MLQNSLALWIIGIVVTLVIGLIGIIATRQFSGTRKHLSFYRSRYPLIEHKVGSSLQLYYEGEEIQDASIIIVILNYRGNEPIRPDDYEQPISFVFDSEARILSVEIVSRKPENLNASVSLEADAKARVEPALFNDRDSVTVKMLVSKCYSLPVISGRIAGVRDIRDALAPTRFEKLFETLLDRVSPKALPLTFVLLLLFLGTFVITIRFEFVLLGGLLGGALMSLAIIAFTVWLSDKMVRFEGD